MSLFLKECERIGTLNEVLEEAGYRQVGPQKQPPLIQRWLPPRPLRVRSLEVSLAWDRPHSLGDARKGLRDGRLHRAWP
jgi:hypothetical protein